MTMRHVILTARQTMLFFIQALVGYILDAMEFGCGSFSWIAPCKNWAHCGIIQFHEHAITFIPSKKKNQIVKSLV